jgi:hypothetical protein
MHSPSRLPSRLAASLEREVLVFGVLAFCALGVAALLPAMLVQDSWLTLVSGREIAEHGLPVVDRLTLWTQGVPWVDQQWLGQLGFFELLRVGGWRLLMLVHAAVLVTTYAVGLVAARRRGASPLSASLVAVVVLVASPWLLQVRTQSLAAPLFVLLLWLLVEDGRRPSGRVFLAIPLLVVWANVHGTVVLGAGLLVLRASLLVIEGVRRADTRSLLSRGLLLLVAAPVCTLASPYGFELLGYYRRMLASPLLREFVVEWRPTAPSGLTAVFYVLAFAAVGLLARQHRRLNGFEKLTLLLTLVGGLSAIRSVSWFTLTALVLVPVLLEGELSAWRSVLRPGLRRVASGLALAVTAAALASGATRPDAWFTHLWPSGAARAVAAAAAQDPSAQILADDRYADWLLWEEPGLRGRVAYDVRFELFTRAQFEQLVDYQGRRPDGLRLARSYRLRVLDLTDSKALQRGLDRPGARLVFRDDQLAVAALPPVTVAKRAVLSAHEPGS